MSKTKDEIEQSEDEWTVLARREGYRCRECGTLIPYDERRIYQSTGYCAACRDEQAKHDRRPFDVMDGKRLADVVGNAIKVMRVATGEETGKRGPCNWTTHEIHRLA